MKCRGEIRCVGLWHLIYLCYILDGAWKIDVSRRMRILIYTLRFSVKNVYTCCMLLSHYMMIRVSFDAGVTQHKLEIHELIESVTVKFIDSVKGMRKTKSKSVKCK